MPRGVTRREEHFHVDISNLKRVAILHLLLLSEYMLDQERRKGKEEKEEKEKE